MTFSIFQERNLRALFFSIEAVANHWGIPHQSQKIFSYNWLCPFVTSLAVGQKKGFDNPFDYRKYGKMKECESYPMITFLIVTSNTRQRIMENQHLYIPWINTTEKTLLEKMDSCTLLLKSFIMFSYFELTISDYSVAPILYTLQTAKF